MEGNVLLYNSRAAKAP